MANVKEKVKTPKTQKLKSKKPALKPDKICTRGKLRSTTARSRSNGYRNGSFDEELESRTERTVRTRKISRFLKDLDFITPVLAAEKSQKKKAEDVVSPKEKGINKTDSKKRKKNETCHICHRRFFFKSQLKRHLLTHLNIRPFTCPHCAKGFSQAGNLKTHIVCRHRNFMDTEKVFICDYCQKPFSLKERLKLHLRLHTGEKPYGCNRCDMTFARKGEVAQHYRRHTGERKYKCKECGANFSCNAKLTLHVKSHLGIREYVCYLCGKGFLRPDAIKKHLACFHFDEKPFECPICEKKLKGHLQEHMRTHRDAKPHACKVCSASFAQRTHLIVHARVHSGERPYRCRVCRRAFAHSSALTLHTRRHTGEKPISCAICSASFAQLPHMKKHMLNIHNQRRPYMCGRCRTFFRAKAELAAHAGACADEAAPRSLEEELSERVSAAHAGVEPPMPLSRMRLLLAILLKKISSDKRLEALGFNKRLVDDILIESLESSGHKPCKDKSYHPAQRLKMNVQMLLDWTVPDDFKARFKTENRSTEELLEELTS